MLEYRLASLNDSTGRPLIKTPRYWTDTDIATPQENPLKLSSVPRHRTRPPDLRSSLLVRMLSIFVRSVFGLQYWALEISSSTERRSKRWVSPCFVSTWSQDARGGWNRLYPSDNDPSLRCDKQNWLECKLKPRSRRLEFGRQVSM